MKNYGFTLIELMVVVLIVAVLAAVLIPYFTARLEAARWSEAKAGLGSIATSIRAVYAEEGPETFSTTMDVSRFMNTGDLKGKYFSIGDYQITALSIDTTAGALYPVLYTIVVYPPTGTGVNWTKNGYQLTHTGALTEFIPTEL